MPERRACPALLVMGLLLPSQTTVEMSFAFNQQGQHGQEIRFIDAGTVAAPCSDATLPQTFAGHGRQFAAFPGPPSFFQ